MVGPKWIEKPDEFFLDEDKAMAQDYEQIRGMFELSDEAVEAMFKDMAGEEREQSN